MGYLCFIYRVNGTLISIHTKHALVSRHAVSNRGVFRGGHGAMPPPLVRHDSINYHRIACKIAAWPPPLLTWAESWGESLSTQTDRIWVKTLFFFFFFWSSPNFGPKTGLNLSEDLFFNLHLILGRKTDWFSVEKFFFWSSLFSNFLPPLLKILRALLVSN